MEEVISPVSINEGALGARNKRKKLRLLLIVLAALFLLLIVPPLIGIGRYKSRIAALISASFGRPVRLSSVELRLLPWPGFVLTDLTVAEDPAYGAEPVLHANTVKASLRLLPLWRGRLEIGSLSVDEASLNVVRTAPGKWNLDPLFRTAAAKAGSAHGYARRFPELEATNSRINFKNGAEKLPFSLVNTDLSFWQESPGEWRVRLRGQPVRTDVVLDMADTGMVRMEATVYRAPELREMPLRLDIDWRQAQLGQLSRLLIGYDPGWRGDLRGELHVEGTPDAANVTAQLRAAGVRRAEFLPPSPLDFDANCTFLYHYSQRAFDDIACSSPLGDGRVQLSGSVPGNAAPHLTLALDRVPMAAGLDVLRTLRSGIDAGLEAAGTVSGKLVYSQSSAGDAAPQRTKPRRSRAPAAQNPLTGTLTIEDFALSGDMPQPLRAPKLVLEPLPLNGVLQGRESLSGTALIPAGAATPLSVNISLARTGYEVGLRGQMSIARARDLAQVAGMPDWSMLQNLTGESVAVNLTAEGPWVPPSPTQSVEMGAGNAPGFAPEPTSSLAADPTASGASNAPAAAPASDILTGTVLLHDATWQAGYLANQVRIGEATLHLGGGVLRFDPIQFTYGPVKGTAAVTVPLNCPAIVPGAATCKPQFAAQFGAIEATTLAKAFLGASRKSTLLSDLIARFHSEPAPLWPAIEGTVKADSFAVGPLTLTHASASVNIAGDRAEITGMTGSALGGKVTASGTVQWSAGAQAGPAYTIEAQCNGLSAAAVGKLLNARWTGGPIGLNGKLKLAGLTGRDLAASAQGALHFDWKHGGMAEGTGKTSASAASALPTRFPARFNDWSGEATIDGNAIDLGDNGLAANGTKQTVAGGVMLGKSPKASFEIKTDASTRHN